MTKIKFCGLSRRCDIEAVNELKPEYIGFVFVKTSKRYVSFEKAEELKSLLDPKIKAVGVFVNEDLKRIEEICDKKVIDIVQLHGLEEEKELNYLRSRIVQPVIKAFCIKKEEDVRQAERSPADFILLDSGAGTGRTFEWEWIKHMERPYFLAGGIHIDNVEKALEQLKPYTVFIMIMCLMMMEICLFWQQTLKATVWKIKLFRLIRRQVKLAVCSIWESYFLIIKKNVRKMKMENWIGYI